jgi:lipopolysaccharide export system permease protein
VPIRLWRYITWQYLRTFAVVLAAVTGIFLVIDFADRAGHYTGPGVVRDVARLYGCKALVVAYQLTPAALLLAGGACMSALRRRGEVTALLSLTVAPAVLYAGVLGGGLLVTGFAFALDQVPVRPEETAKTVLGWAGQTVDEISAVRFRQWGDFSTYYGPRQWFRGKDRIYFLRRAEGSTYVDVSIFSLTPDFRLAGRIDAERMEPQPDGRWKLVHGSERAFPSEGTTHLQPFTERLVRFPEAPGELQLRRGRPEQMTLKQLQEEGERRQRLGLPAAGYLLALHNKLAYPAIGLPAALLAAALALRRNRKGHLTAALLEGVAIVGVLWFAHVIFRASAVAGHLDPAIAAWAPVALLTGGWLAAVAWLD